MRITTANGRYPRDTNLLRSQITATLAKMRSCKLCIVVATLLLISNQFHLAQADENVVQERSTHSMEEHLIEATERSYAAILKLASSKGTLNTSQQETERVREIAQRVIAQTPTVRSDISRWKWEVNLLDESQTNISAMPGGKIIVYKGLVFGYYWLCVSLIPHRASTTTN